MVNIDELVEYFDVDTLEDQRRLTLAERELIIDALILYKEMN